MTRARRTNEQIERFDAAVRSIVARVRPATCRQIFYRAVVARLVKKDGRGYRWVCDSLVRQRWGGAVPWAWIVDESRSVRGPEMWADAGSGLEAFAERYRRDAWRSQPWWTELWVESDSLAGTLVDVTWRLGVPLYSGRGFSSITAMRLAAEQIAARIADRGQPTRILYVGDLDPSGWEASAASARSLEAHLEDMGHDPGVFVFERIAANPEQVDAFDLPTGAPPKKKGPGSASWWQEDGPRLAFTVEAEAFEPEQLRQLVRDAILDWADRDALQRAWRTEEIERETLRAVALGGLPFKHGKGGAP